MTEQNILNRPLGLSCPASYDMYHFIISGSFHDRPDRCNDRHRPTPGSLLDPPGSLFDLPADRGPGRIGGNGNAGHQYPAALPAADGGVAPCLDRGGDVVDHGIPRGVRARPARGRPDLGSLRTALAGVDRICGIPCRQRLVRPRHRPAEPPDRPRRPGRRRLLDLGAVARHRPRSLQRRGAGALHDYFGWRSEFVFVGVFAAISAIAYATVLGETHRSTRIPLNPLAIARNYLGLIADRRFLVPAATVSLIMGGLFAMFSAAPRVFIEGLHFTPIQLGLFFAGTVMIVFAAGMLATKLAPRFGLDRSIQGGLLAAATGSIAMLLVSLFNPTFLPFLAAMCVFLLGMGIVNPLGTAQALSPFGEKAGAASALVGFWQMMSAAVAVWLTATVSHDAMFALGIVLTVASLLALGLYTMRAKTG